MEWMLNIFDDFLFKAEEFIVMILFTLWPLREII